LSSNPQNFDEFYNGNRAFIIGGGTFHWRPIHWREWGEILDTRAAQQYADEAKRKERIAALVATGKGEFDAELEVDEQIDQEETTVESFEEVIERICVYLVPEDIASFKSVANDKSKNISVAMLHGLMVWLQGVQTPDRPTETLSPSSSSPGTTGATSPVA
jgi:hypothetical protein